MTGFSIDPGQLRKRGSDLEAVGADAVGELRGSRGVITGSTPWGSDEAGTVFGEAHAELAAVADEVLTLFTDAIEAAGHNVRAMGDDYEEADGVGRDDFDSIAGGLGEVR